MIVSRSAVVLSDSQKKLISSGWGDGIVENVSIERIAYESDGEIVDGYIAHPGKTEGKLPLIIWNRGGNLKEGAIDEFLATGMYGEIASWGYVLLASQYRKNEEFGGSDVNDILNLIPVAESLPFCDTDSIGMEGWSRGGMMAYRVLTMTGRIKCAVIVSGLADLQKREKDKKKLSGIYPHIFGDVDPAVLEQNLRSRSAVTFAEEISPETAILLIHGTGDSVVPHEDSAEMHRLLAANGRNAELRLIEDGDHYLKGFRKEVTEMRRAWFDKFLKN